MDDVAALSGVSRGTVSRVLNGAHHVSPAALAAVQRAVAETGYVINSSARSLVTRRAGAVAFLLSEPQERLFEDPNFNVLLRHTSQALAEHDLSMVLMVAGGGDRERERVLRYVRAGHVDAVLLVSTHGGDPLVDELVAGRVPVVACGVPLGHEDRVPHVAARDREGAREMTAYLRSLGRARIATITGPMDTSGGQERLEGFRDVLGRRAARARISHASGYTFAAGELAMEQLLRTAPDLDAVFVASDLLAAGALAALHRAGRRVPDDVAVGGFDDSQIALTTQPPLTTMHQPFDLVARAMVEIAVELTQGEEQPVASRTVPTRLVRRASA
jgi:DNA-binding LacI/PurR family transcriptional regulator